MKDAAHVADRIVAWVRDQIRQCQLVPGDVLRQDAIAKRFGTSKPPVREALSRLEAGLYVERKRNRGFYIRQFTQREIVGHFEMCAVCEAHAVLSGGRRLSRRDVDALAACAERLAIADDVVEWLELDADFHVRLLGGVANEVLKTNVAAFHRYYFRSHATALARDGALPKPVAEYRAIVADLRAGNLAAAAARVHLHMTERARQLSAAGPAARPRRIAVV